MEPFDPTLDPFLTGSKVIGAWLTTVYLVIEVHNTHSDEPSSTTRAHGLTLGDACAEADRLRDYGSRWQISERPALAFAGSNDAWLLASDTSPRSKWSLRRPFGDHVHPGRCGATVSAVARCLAPYPLWLSRSRPAALRLPLSSHYSFIEARPSRSRERRRPLGWDLRQEQWQPSLESAQRIVCIRRSRRFDCRLF